MWKLEHQIQGTVHSQDLVLGDWELPGGKKKA